MEKKRKEWFLRYDAAVFILLLVIGACVIGSFYRTYQKQVILAGEFLSSSGEKLEKGTLLLKGKQETFYEDAKKKLADYGYGKLQANVYGRDLIKSSLLTAALLFGIFLAWILYSRKVRQSERRRQQKELDQISRVLRQFQEDNLDVDIWEILEEKEQTDIYMQLESMEGYLRMLTEQSLKEREETKTLVTDISHQLKTPVAALKACFEILLKEDLTKGERDEFSKRCEEQLIGLVQLVEALVNISRMENGMISIRKEKSRIFDTLLEAVNRVYLKAQEKEITMELDAAKELQKLEIAHDGKWLCEAFINLLENAVKYSPKRSTVTIRMVQRTSFLRIEFKDQGIGVPKEEQHQIFQRFYRGSSSEVADQAGSGVGLYLTREIISGHQGTIMVLSGARHKEQGSTFVIQLPYQ